MTAIFGPFLTPSPLPTAFRQYIMTALLKPFLPLSPSPLRSYLKYAPLGKETITYYVASGHTCSQWNETETVGEHFVLDDGSVVVHVNFFNGHRGDV